MNTFGKNNIERFNFKDTQEKGQKYLQYLAMIGSLLVSSSVFAQNYNKPINYENTGVGHKENPKIIKKPFVEEPAEINLEENDTTTLNLNAFFKTSTVEFISKDAEEKAKGKLKEFIQDINLFETKIRILGTYSIERDWEYNEQIAKLRRDKGVEIFIEVLEELGYSTEEIKKILENTEKKDRGMSAWEFYSTSELNKMTEEEYNAVLDRNQGIFYQLIPPVVLKKEIQSEPKPNLYENIRDFRNFKGVVVIDPSGSMRNKAEEVENLLSVINNERNQGKILITKIQMEGSNTELHLKTLEDLLRGRDLEDGSSILVLTDEPDDTFEKEKAENIVFLAKQKNIKIVFKILRPYKIVNKANPNFGIEKGFLIFELDYNNLDLLGLSSEEKKKINSTQDEVTRASWYKKIYDFLNK